MNLTWDAGEVIEFIYKGQQDSYFSSMSTLLGPIKLGCIRDISFGSNFQGSKPWHLSALHKWQGTNVQAKFPEMLQLGSANGLVMHLCFKNQCHCRVCGCDPWTRATDIWMTCNTIVFDHLHALSDKAITKHGQKEENPVDIIPRYISSLKGMVHLLFTRPLIFLITLS